MSKLAEGSSIRYTKPPPKIQSKTGCLLLLLLWHDLSQFWSLMCHICWSWLAIRHGGSKSSLANVDLNCAVANCPFVVKIKLLWKIVTQFYCSVMITSRSFQYWFSCTLAREAEERGRDPQCNIWKTSSYWNRNGFWNFVVISESFGCQPQKVRQTSLWQMVPKFSWTLEAIIDLSPNTNSPFR